MNDSNYRYNNTVAPYQPKLSEATKGAISKRSYQPEEKNYVNNDEIQRKDLDPSLDPASTQKRILVRVEYSNEGAIRQILQPNFTDRINVYDDWMKELERERIKTEKKLQKRRRWERRKQQLENTKKNNSEEDKENFDDLEDSDSSDEEEETQRAALHIREKKLCQNRVSYKAHSGRSFFRKVKTSVSLQLTLGWRSRVLTEVLPWMWIGDASMAANSTVLLKLGITHVMNCTHDVCNRIQSIMI